MGQKFDIGLNAQINEFAKKFKIERTPENDAEVFEEYGNYVIASNLLEEEIESLNSISTNLSQGLDGIVIVVNDRLITDIDGLNKLGETEALKVKCGFIQSTTQKRFDEQKFQAFTDEVVKFLTEEISIEPFSSIYKALFNESDRFIDRLIETPSVFLYFLSGRTNHDWDEEIIRVEKNKINNRAELENKCVLQNVFVYQKEEIKAEYNKIAKYHTVQLKLDANVQLPSIDCLDFSLLALISFSELKKLILTNDGNIKERLFVENVRNFVGSTPVNMDIKESLNSEDTRRFFPYLNNGLVIICNKIERHTIKLNEFILTFPRIINGCQTTNVLYNQYKELDNKEELNGVCVVAKIISTKDDPLKKKIVYAANNQNSIDKDLQSLNAFHEKIEQYFNGKDGMSVKLYFERLRGQHPQVTPPYSKINIENLARIYISVLLRSPHTMKSNAIKRIEEERKKGNVFNEKDDVSKYYYCAILYYWMCYFLVNNNIRFSSKTMDMHVLMSCDILLFKTKKTVEEKIDFLKDQDNALSLFSKVVDVLNAQDFLFERRGFYSNPKVQRLIKFLNSFDNDTNSTANN